MLRAVVPLVSALLLAQQPCEGTAVATGRRAALRSRAKSVEQAACDCSSCVGERRNEGGDGSVGFQCFPGSSDLDDCMQTGSASDWVVQSAKVLSYDRFCLYTCKPLLRNKIEAKVDCKMLNHEEITLSAQSPTFNGNEIVYKAHPMASVGPISRLVSLPMAQMFGMGAATASSDPLAQLKNTFASIRKVEAESGGVGSPFELPSYAKAPPLCVCHCGKDTVNRLAKKPGGPHLHPPKVPKISWPSGPSPVTDAEPMEPPMPPPPPADLPPPAMPMGMGPVLQELPAVPEAPPEVTGPLDLQLVQASAAAAAPSPASAASQSPAGAEEAVSFLQYGQLKATPTGLTCQCVC